MRPRPVRLVPALCLALAVGVVAGARRARPTRPRPGPPGIGDPYFPLDGNGGIDVLHYDVRDRYDFGSGLLTGRTTLTVRATQDLSRFNLDFLLKVTRVRVDGRAAAFDRGNRHELRITPAAAAVAPARSSPSRCATRAGRPTRRTAARGTGSPTPARSSR